MAIFSYYFRSTSRTDIMARLVRHSGRLVFPADALLTPHTFNRVKVLPQRQEVLAKLSILRLEREKPCGQLISLPQHSGIHSLHQQPDTSPGLSTVT
jgi:hypothetical protein